jgi:hypothetical protein
MFVCVSVSLYLCVYMCLCVCCVCVCMCVCDFAEISRGSEPDEANLPAGARQLQHVRGRRCAAGAIQKWPGVCFFYSDVSF